MKDGETGGGGRLSQAKIKRLEQNLERSGKEEWDLSRAFDVEEEKMRAGDYSVLNSA